MDWHGEGFGTDVGGRSGPIIARREQVLHNLAGSEAARLGEMGQAVGSRRRNQKPDEALAAPGKVGLILLPRYSAPVNHRNG